MRRYLVAFLLCLSGCSFIYSGRSKPTRSEARTCIPAPAPLVDMALSVSLMLVYVKGFPAGGAESKFGSDDDNDRPRFGRLPVLTGVFVTAVSAIYGVSAINACHREQRDKAPAIAKAEDP